MADYSKNVEESVKKLKKLREEMHRVIVGQDEVLDLIQLALLCEGHVAGRRARVGKDPDGAYWPMLYLWFSRIQFTPDLMPADVLGNSIVMQEKAGDFTLRFEKGPIFANLVLADEINRASPKTQSALLEAMQEQAVTVRESATNYPVRSRSWPPKTRWRWRVHIRYPRLK